MNYEKAVNEKVQQMIPSGIRKVNDQAVELEKKGMHVVHLELGRPDFDTPEYIKEAAAKALREGKVFYTQNAGILRLREAVAEKLKSQNHICYTPDEILITTGLAEAVFDTLSAILEPGDEIFVPDPVWMNYRNIPQVLGAKPVPYTLLEEREYQPDFSGLAKKVTAKTKAVIIVSPGNPTGSVLSQESLEQLAAFAKEHDLLVVSDEIYERIRYDGKACTSIASLPGMKERTITLNGFSKTYSMTGWRLGYLAGPKALVQQIAKLHQVVTTCAASFVQEAGICALREEHGEVQAMVEEYERRRNYLVQAINEIPGLSCRTPDGAFYLWVNIKELGVSDEKFAGLLLRNAHVAVVPGSVFGEAGKGYIRLSYASSLTELKEAVKQIRNLIADLKQ